MMDCNGVKNQYGASGPELYQMNNEEQRQISHKLGHWGRRSIEDDNGSAF